MALSGYRFVMYITKEPLPAPAPAPVATIWCIKSFSIDRTNAIVDTTTFVDDTVNFLAGHQDNSIGIRKATYNITAHVINSNSFVTTTPLIGERILLEFFISPNLDFFAGDYVVVKSITNTLDVSGAYQIDFVAERDIEAYI